jgi:hypothetical protein
LEVVAVSDPTNAAGTAAERSTGMSPTPLTKREHGRRILEALFADRDRVAIAEAVAAGAEHHVSRRTLVRACRDLGVREVHNGPFAAFWERPKGGDAIG